MPLVTYDHHKYNLDTFATESISAFQRNGYYLVNVGLLTNSPGVMFALSYVERVDDSQLHSLKSIFYKLGAKSVTTELNNMNNKIYFQVHVQGASKPGVCTKIYKCIPPLPVILLLVLCLYEMNKEVL